MATKTNAKVKAKSTAATGKVVKAKVVDKAVEKTARPADKTGNAKPAAKLDAFAEHSIAALKARGLRVADDVVDMLIERAEASEETYFDIARAFSLPWRATALLSFFLRRCDEGEFLPDILSELADVDDRQLLTSALTELKERDLVVLLSDAEDALERDGLQGDISGFAPPQEEDRLRLRKKIAILVGGMAEPFPG